MEKPYEIKKSGIHGTGVFAARKIKKGEKVAEYVGEIVSSAEGQRIEEESLKKNGTTYVMELGDSRDINGDVEYNDARFINHSCDPNCETKISGIKVEIVAIEDVDVGEEITYDYDFEFDDESEYLKHKCFCGSKECEGHI